MAKQHKIVSPQHRVRKQVWWQCNHCKKYVLGTAHPPQDACDCQHHDFVRVLGTGRAAGRRVRVASGALYETQRDGSLRRLK